jgi:hypothetical protein
MFLLTLSHAPGPERIEQAKKFVREREPESGREGAFADLAYVLLNSSEFIYIR